MIIVKPSKDILQLNKGFRFERNSTAFDELGNLYFPHNARFAQGKFGKALFVEEGTRNLINTDLEKWGQGYCTDDATGELIYRTDPLYGKVLRINKTDTGPGRFGIFKRFGGFTGYVFTETIYIRPLSETGTAVPIFVDQATSIKVVKLSSLTLGEWIRFSNTRFMIDELREKVFVYIWIQSNYGVCEFCLPQAELKPYATTFINGTRSPEIVTIPVNTISPTEGQWDHYVYVNDMARRQVAGQTPTLFHIPRQDGGMGIRVCHAEDSANWKLQTMDDTNDITEVDAPDSLTPDGWHRFTVKWTEAEAKLLIDGVVAGTIANPALPSAFASEGYVGSYDGSKDFLNTLHDDIRVSNIARADADDLADFEADQPLPTDANTIYKQSFDSPNDMYVRQGLII